MNLNLSPIQDELNKLEAVREALQTELDWMTKAINEYKAMAAPEEWITDVEKQKKQIERLMEIVK